MTAAAPNPHAAPPLSLIAIGFAKRALEPGSREHARMRAYAAALHRFDLIVLTRRRDGFAAPVHAGNLTVYPTNARTKLGMLFAAYRLARRLAQARAGEGILTVVSSQDPFETSLIGRAAVRGTAARHHVQLHTDAFGSPHWRRESLLNRLRARYGRFVLCQADAVRVVSARLARSLTDFGVPAARITVLPIQFDLAPFLAVGRARPYAALPHPFCFAYVGRLTPEKNLPLALEALALARSGGAPATLTLIGDGPERARLERLVSALALEDAVRFVPWTDDVPAALADADALLLTSNYEGWGLVLLEAMAAGLPVVTTDVGCAGEVVKDGEHGYVVPVGDRQALATALAHLAANPVGAAAFGYRAHRTAAAFATAPEAYLAQWVAAHRPAEG